MKFAIGDKIQAWDIRNAKHLQLNAVYKVYWCSEKYVRLSMSEYQDGGGRRPTMYSVDRFDKVVADVVDIPQ